MNIIENKQYKKALERTIQGLDLAPLSGKTLFISGATGMIGSCIADMVMTWNQTQTDPCRVTVANRRREAAAERFAPWWSNSAFSHASYDASSNEFSFSEQYDYIIHAASNADPVKVAQFPVDTLLSNVCGTRNLIEYGKNHGMKRFLYLSSGEMYGQPNERFDDFVEGYCGPVDHSSPRACYPVGKRASEVLIQSYIAQYGIEAVIVRPCHIFGPTMTRSDSRAASEFLRSAAAGENIVLKSAGTVERSQCYVLDAAAAMLQVLLYGKNGEAYNIADKKYQMLIREFAQRAAEAGGTELRFEKPSDLEARGYSKVGRAVLDATKLRALGWKPHDEIDAIEETVEILRTTKGE